MPSLNILCYICKSKNMSYSIIIIKSILQIFNEALHENVSDAYKLTCYTLLSSFGIQWLKTIDHSGHKDESDQLSVAPRAFQVDQLPSTPQLNAIMDRAMGKVKSMIMELEADKGRIKTKLFQKLFL